MVINSHWCIHLQIWPKLLGSRTKLPRWQLVYIWMSLKIVQWPIWLCEHRPTMYLWYLLFLFETWITLWWCLVLFVGLHTFVITREVSKTLVSDIHGVRVFCEQRKWFNFHSFRCLRLKLSQRANFKPEWLLTFLNYLLNELFFVPFCQLFRSMVLTPYLKYIASCAKCKTSLHVCEGTILDINMILNC